MALFTLLIILGIITFFAIFLKSEKWFENNTPKLSETMKEKNTITEEKTTTLPACIVSTTNVSKITPMVVEPPLVLLFAEYMGYKSKVLSWAQDWCEGKEIENYKKKIVEVDAHNIYLEMKNMWTDEELHEWYDKFYDTILYEYDDNLKKMSDE